MLQPVAQTASKMATDFNWPIHRADLFAIDNDLDEEYRKASDEGIHVHGKHCESCSQYFFFGLDKHGEGSGPHGSEPDLCNDCLSGSGKCLRCDRDYPGDGEGLCSQCCDYVDAH
jgi:hypothetical protein